MWRLRKLMLAGGVLVALSICGAMPAGAWGRRGHEVVGYLAERLLTPQAQAEVRALIGPEGLQQVASWADDVRNARPATRPLHYVNIDIRSAGYDAAADCPQGACVVEVVNLYAGRLGDRSLAAPIRAEALRFLVHFVGDMHQPLHAGDNQDAGGNEVRVRLGSGDPQRLHAVWDTAVVEVLGPDTASIGRGLLLRIRRMDRRALNAVRAGRPVDWATEAWAISRDRIYRPLGGGELPPPGGTGAAVVTLPSDYAGQQSEIVQQQLSRAGIRLAAVLNTRLRGAAP
jgi:S1/P1 Nuclease